MCSPQKGASVADKLLRAIHKKEQQKSGHEAFVVDLALSKGQVNVVPLTNEGQPNVAIAWAGKNTVKCLISDGCDWLESRSNGLSLAIEWLAMLYLTE